MSNRINQAALKIRLLLEEYSATELSQALSVLGEKEATDVQHFFSRLKPARAISAGRDTREPSVLQELKQSQPEKYRLIAAFARDLAEDRVLPTMDEIRTF